MSTAASAGVLVGTSDQVAEGGRLIVDIGERTVGIFRLEGALYAYENNCVHMGGPACQGKIIAGVAQHCEKGSDRDDLYFNEGDMHVVCPWHGYEYSIKTGRHAGVSRLGLRQFTVEEVDGNVYVVA